VSESFEKWLSEARKIQGGMANEATRREAQNELARAKQQKKEGLKDYEKAQLTQAAKSAKLRELRLAREAQERVAAETDQGKPKAKRAASAPRKRDVRD
jgi:hypothetical protein